MLLNWKKSLLYILPVMMIAGCAKELPLPSSEIDKTENVDPNVVTLDEALDEMNDFIDAVKISDTRSVSNPQIASIDILKSPYAHKMQTRSGIVAHENMAYVVNFANDGGFTILSSDKRTEPVYCFTEKGNFTIAEINEIANELLYSPDTTTVRPSQGESEILLENNDDEDDEWTPVEDAGFIKEMIVAHLLAADYARIKEYEDGARTRAIVYETTDWTMVEGQYIAPKLTTEWDQDYPFNMWCRPVKSAAGCVAIALAQAMANIQYPAPSRFKSTITKSWAELKNYNYNWEPRDYAATDYQKPPYYNYSTEDQMAAMISMIGNGVDMDYSPNGSGTSSSKAKKYLQKMNVWVGVRDGQYLLPDIKWILKEFSKGVAYISAYRNTSEGKKGHAWVIDGWANQMRVTQKFVDGVLSTVSTESRDLVHCNWGWGGQDNGWFTSGWFDPKEKVVFRAPASETRATVDETQYHLNYYIIQIK